MGKNFQCSNLVFCRRSTNVAWNIRILLGVGIVLILLVGIHFILLKWVL